MANLAISTEFLNSYAKLEKRQRNRVSKLADLFHRQSAVELRSNKGIHLESHAAARDPRARTIRIDDNHRGIVIDAGDNETFILTTIGTHDETDRWMSQNTFKVNEATGALEILNTVEIEEAIKSPRPKSTVAALFAHRNDKEFTKLGVDSDLLPALRAFTNEDQLLSLLLVLPQSQSDALMGLLGEGTVEEIYSDVAGSVDPGNIDTDDLVGALTAPASQSQFQVIAGEDELSEMLAQPFSQWRLFLHHTQREFAYRQVFNGPARVTGGAGTGKTVVAMHRARHLAKQLSDRDGKPILFTTFTRNLAQVIRQDLLNLGGTELLDVTEVTNVDSFAHQVVRDAEGASPRVILDDALQQMWERAADQTGTERSPEFLRHEWEHVVLAQRCQSRSDYFQASRAGRGIPLDRRSRAEVWKAIEAFLQLLDDSGSRTYLQLADAAAGYLEARTIRPFQHVVVDEAQDLHESQWRLLRAAVAEGANDMFVVGDSHQRIYDRRSSLSRVGIKIVGRSKKLRINYRTTHEILRWSMAMLGEGDFDDLDDGTETDDAAGYHSFLHGPSPIMAGHGSAKEQMDALVGLVKGWVDDGIDISEIAVAARSHSSLKAVQGVFERAEIDCLLLDRELPQGQGVQLGTMHRMKGLEFRAVAVVDVDDARVPSHMAMTDKVADEVQYRLDLRRECCLLYVACTRARTHLWVGWSGNASRFLGPMLGT